MIKINLLPRIVNEKAVVRNTAIVFTVLLIAIIVGGIAFNYKLTQQVQAMDLSAQQAEQWKARVEDIQKQTTDLQASVAPIKAKLDFIDNVLKYNGVFPQLYEQIAKWTYGRVVYSSMTSDGTQVTMSAHAKTLDELGRYLLNMYRATDLFTEVNISGTQYPTGQTSSGSPAPAPAFEGGGQIGGSNANLAGIGAIGESLTRLPQETSGITFSVACKLKTPIAAPAYTGGAPAPGAVPAAGGAVAPPPAPVPAQ